MVDTLLAIKKNMSSGYDLAGRRVGTTILEVPTNFVTQIKDQGRDGYRAVQLGSGIKKSVKKPQLGHLNKAGVSEKVGFLREVSVNSSEDIQLGQPIKVNQVFAKGDLVKVTGTSKGHGFAGGVKRFGFKGGPKTHGQSDRHRAPGSSGSGTTPGRVYKGKRRPGHYGADTVSYTGLEVLAVDRKNNLLIIKGSVPGYSGNLVLIEKQGHIKGHTPEPEAEEVVSSENEEMISPETVQAVETEAVPESSAEVKAETRDEVETQAQQAANTSEQTPIEQVQAEGKEAEEVSETEDTAAEEVESNKGG